MSVRSEKMEDNVLAFMLFFRKIDARYYEAKKKRVFDRIDATHIDSGDEYVARVIYAVCAAIKEKKIEARFALKISDPKKMGEDADVSLDEVKEKSSEQLQYLLKQQIDSIEDNGYQGLQSFSLDLLLDAIYMIRDPIYLQSSLV